MSGVNFHLLLNHFPMFALGVGLLIGIWGFYWKQNIGLKLYYLLAIAAYSGIFLSLVTGHAALEHITDKHSLSKELRTFIHHHEEMAESFQWLYVIGLLLSGLGAYGIWRPFRFSRKIFLVSVCITLATLIVIGLIAHVGAEIRHPDVRW